MVLRSSHIHICRNVDIARRFEYKTGEFIMHAKRENKQGENGICRWYMPHHYPRILLLLIMRRDALE